MPKRELTNAVNWLLDNAIPPFLRDSKIFMSPFMRMILGKKYTYYMKFKDDLSTLTDIEIDEYYNIPYGDPTAEHGKWEKGPGYDLFRVMKEKLGNKAVIAEDLGFLTPSEIGRASCRERV